MGEVYRAKDTRLDRTVAVKIMTAGRAMTLERSQRFEREARAISSLQHPHICMLLDVGKELGEEYLVTEYLEGETLAARLQKGALDPRVHAGHRVRGRDRRRARSCAPAGSGSS
jgi:serine/threonine protein kinase